MITPSYGLTATERVLPRLALDFTTASLDPRITFTRLGNTATVTNSSGVIVDINANLPRFDYNPSTLVCRGLLIEESRTNALLNSLLNGTSLATQSVTVTAAARTLSFYGTGQIVLSGAASATVVGNGAYPTRTTFTFTPSAGTLTLTVTGTVQFAQLEIGTFATSFIPTAGSAVTRNDDIVLMTGTNFTSWYNATQGSIVFQGSYLSGANIGLVSINDGTTSNRITFQSNSSTQINFRYVSASGNYTGLSPVFTAASTVKSAFAYLSNSQAAYLNTNTYTSVGNQATIPTATQMQIGIGPAVNRMSGHVQKIYYWPQRLTNAELAAFTK